jgi:uncharacterized protein involved in tolerance to divalent cations
MDGMFEIDDNGILRSWKGRGHRVEIPEGVRAIFPYTFKDRTSIEEVSFPSTLESVGEHSFERCTRIKSISIPDSVASIGDYAFSRCYSLVDVSLGNEIANIGNKAFSGCAIRSIELPASLSELGIGVFDGCVRLKRISVAEGSKRFDSIGKGILYDVWHASIVRCPEGMTGAVEVPVGTRSIGAAAFAGCTRVSSISFGFPSSVSFIDQRAFMDCLSIQSIELPGSLSSVAPSAFMGWTPRQSVSYSSVEPEASDDIERALAKLEIKNEGSANLAKVTTTYESIAEARAAGEKLVLSGLAAACQTEQIESVYVWEGKPDMQREFRLTAITTERLAPHVMMFIDKRHSAELGETLSYAIAGSGKLYADWVHENAWR